MTASPQIVISVLAHNEERRIAGCLDSLPLDRSDIAVHVVVNGSMDRTAEIARSYAAVHPCVTVHAYAQGGKSRAWNRFVLDDCATYAPVHVFVDGDAQIAPGSIEALVQGLADNPLANAASALPLNGRHVHTYRLQLMRRNGLFGDLYALRGDFLERMRSAGIRLPDDLVGDDGLVGALAKTDLGPDSNWDDARIIPCEGAGFLCEPVSLVSPRTWQVQYRRMINYSVRHFQDRIVRGLMRGPGPQALPRLVSSLYPQWLPEFGPRNNPRWWWFDRLALARMARASETGRALEAGIPSQ